MSMLAALWQPIVLSAILVFILSAIIHMVLKYHNSDYRKLPNEDAVRSAIRSGNPAPGQYVFPHCADMKEMGSPEMQQKFIEGPVGLAYLKRPGPPSMGPTLGQWFLFNLWVALLVAFVASRAIAPGTAYSPVFVTVAAVTFLAYGAALLPASIWMGKPWAVTAKEMFDAVLYALVTAGTFGWLWPR